MILRKIMYPDFICTGSVKMILLNVTVAGFWVHDRILIQRVTTIYNSLLHTYYCPQSRLH
jgi:hypothetical protein